MTVMEIDKNPPGLISRRMFPIDQGRVVMEEHWDINVPGCPMIRNPWNPLVSDASNCIRQVVMTREEYDAAFPLFGHGQQQESK